MRGQHVHVALPYWDYVTPTCGTRLAIYWKACNGSTPNDVPANTAINGLVEGLNIDLLEMMSVRWGFNYTVYRSADRNQSTTAWLREHGDSYDLIGGGWSDTLERRKMGFIWPHYIYDNSPRLVVSLHEEDPAFWDTMVGFATPFTPRLWGVIFGCAIGTASFIWMFEISKVGHEHDEESELTLKHGYKGVLKSWYLAGGHFTGGGGYTPTTVFGRLVVLSWSFAVLILVASCAPDFSHRVADAIACFTLRIVLQTRPTSPRVSS